MFVIALAAVLWAMVSASASLPDVISTMPNTEGDVYDHVSPVIGHWDEHGMPLTMEETEFQVLESEDDMILRETDNDPVENLRMTDESYRNKIAEALLQTRSKSSDKAVNLPNQMDKLSHGLRSFRPVDCAEHLVMGATKSGVYKIYPFTCVCSEPVKVWCDMETDGGGWTVITNRLKEGSEINFNRTWADYQTGFGNMSSEFWMGNRLIHEMTTARNYQLRMDVKISATEFLFGAWPSFNILNEASRYTLRFGRMLKVSTLYTDCLKDAKGQKFSANNRDFDRVSGDHCSNQRGVGWWYKTCSVNIFDPSYPINKCYTNVRMTPLQIQLKIRPSICSSTMKTVLINKYECGLCQ